VQNADYNVVVRLSVMRPRREYFAARLRQLLNRWDPYSGHCRVASMEILAGENPIPPEWLDEAMASLPLRVTETTGEDMNFIVHTNGRVTGDDGALFQGPPSDRLSVGDVYVDRGVQPAEAYRWNGTEWVLVSLVQPMLTHYPHGLDDPQPYPPAD
jgi:hypothetical protein